MLTFCFCIYVNFFCFLGGAPLLPPAPLRPPGTEYIQLPPVSGPPYLAPPGAFIQPPGTQSQLGPPFNQEENEENSNQYENHNPNQYENQRR